MRFFIVQDHSFSGVFGEQDENTYITSYEYDNNGNIISRTTPNGDAIKYIYDKLNRLTNEILSNVVFGFISIS